MKYIEVCYKNYKVGNINGKRDNYIVTIFPPDALRKRFMTARPSLVSDMPSTIIVSTLSVSSAFLSAAKRLAWIASPEAPNSDTKNSVLVPL